MSLARAVAVILRSSGIIVRYADSSSLEELRAAISPRTRLVHIETPGNPLLSVTDIAAVAELARVTSPGHGRCVVSVPWEPWFRLGNLGRGKNVRRGGNDPEHLSMFTSPRLRAALEPHFDSVRVVPAFPWLVAEARSPCRGR